MSQKETVAFLNREQTLLSQAKIPVNDRGFLFADVVYEVVRVYKGKPFLMEEHMSRLAASLASLSMPNHSFISGDVLRCIEANNLEEGIIYIQMSRGVAARNHSFFGLDLKPTTLIYAVKYEAHPFGRYLKTGMSAITHPDQRWGRCDVKTVNLLANCLAQTKANQMGYEEAILYRQEDLITEATAANVFYVKDKVIKTPPLSRFILPGTRRGFVIKAMMSLGYRVEERGIKKDDLYTADELFLTSTTKEAIAITKLDQEKIGDGKPGPITQAARKAIMDSADIS